MNDEYPEIMVFENQGYAQLYLMLFILLLAGLIWLASFEVIIMVESLNRVGLVPLIAFLALVMVVMYVHLVVILNLRERVEISSEIRETVVLGGVRTYEYDDITSFNIRTKASGCGPVRLHIRINNGNQMVLETTDFTSNQIESFLGQYRQTSKMKVTQC
ncbi:MAG: hypothetical protein COW62_06600 [Zetaproteobacteria bacterium CG17_big_fil_post_rev_8_21_14_2_50_50_13]|nr:MAG: hypothetical protein AUJ56_00925 [Zetaproteobacteria bacterium CG1_02_49_23]PIQ32938.1 MAG: hypothetical protein COW62_06600 [Zetaproteobacteria bacterium CG17_big_fil_post_rev_8_21_14_2_50_50_13]PIY56555.1 MAG: hypothetical protein COZ00_03660 [Zetaproteobacteria bacterium CG_4_10_14_0_8_um_filter_49_80]